MVFIPYIESAKRGKVSFRKEYFKIRSRPDLLPFWMWPNFEPKFHLYWVKHHFERGAGSFKFGDDDLTDEEYNFAQLLKEASAEIGRISCKVILDSVNKKEADRKIGKLCNNMLTFLRLKKM